MSRYENSVDAEVQQRAVEFLALSRNGLAMVDIMAEMPKFPERQVWIKLGSHQVWIGDRLQHIWR